MGAERRWRRKLQKSEISAKNGNPLYTRAEKVEFPLSREWASGVICKVIAKPA